MSEAKGLARVEWRSWDDEIDGIRVVHAQAVLPGGETETSMAVANEAIAFDKARSRLSESLYNEGFELGFFLGHNNEGTGE